MRNANDPGRPLLRGIAVCPGTPVEAVEPLLDDVEAVFLLAVDPGWGGQKFIPSTGRRFEKLRSLIGNRNLLTGLDGGVTQDNIAGNRRPEAGHCRHRQRRFRRQDPGQEPAADAGRRPPAAGRLGKVVGRTLVRRGGLGGTSLSAAKGVAAAGDHALRCAQGRATPYRARGKKMNLDHVEQRRSLAN